MSLDAATPPGTPAWQPGSARGWALLILVAAAVVAADQGTKLAAVATLTRALDGREAWTEKVAGFYSVRNLDNDPAEPGRSDLRLPPKPVVSRYWDHRYVENAGAAWGLLSRVPDRYRVPFFHAVSLIALGLMLGFYRKLEADQRAMAAGLALLFGGALGNYLDRLARGYVIDFIDWHWREAPNLHWPTFNLADAAISAGVVLLLLDTLLARPKPAQPLESQKEAGTGAWTAPPHKQVP